ncbi:MAG: hypothetical protein IJT36_03920 [Alphaproteobacteria bacterium]|nr:hypothetical protein [Alphaproteobacteria bacterium]
MNQQGNFFDYYCLCICLMPVIGFTVNKQGWFKMTTITIMIFGLNWLINGVLLASHMNAFLCSFIVSLTSLAMGEHRKQTVEIEYYKPLMVWILQELLSRKTEGK